MSEAWYNCSYPAYPGEKFEKKCNCRIDTFLFPPKEGCPVHGKELPCGCVEHPRDRGDVCPHHRRG